MPLVDEQQDYKLADFQESDGKTLLKFTRKFDTCDPRDRKLEVCVYILRIERKLIHSPLAHLL